MFDVRIFFRYNLALGTFNHGSAYGHYTIICSLSLELKQLFEVGFFNVEFLIAKVI